MIFLHSENLLIDGGGAEQCATKESRRAPGLEMKTEKHHESVHKKLVHDERETADCENFQVQKGCSCPCWILHVGSLFFNV